MTIEELYQVYLKHPVICTDTRKISKDCIFFALKGENFDGNHFALQALKSGAAFAVIDQPEAKTDPRCLLLDDVLSTLQELARYHRKQLQIPFIGITGTNGKTTSKELIKSVLSQKFNTYATLGNLNNHIGVPLTILSITAEVEIAIIEMGANHQKEIAFLSSIARPTHGLITNVGKAHLEGFGGFEGVKKGKGELYDFLAASKSAVFINRDNEHLMEMSASRKMENVIYYGSQPDCTVQGKIVQNNPLLSIEWKTEKAAFPVDSNLTGTYNLENLLAAVAIGLHFGLSPEEINKGIEAYIPGNNRSQVTKTESNTLICDFYNANPSSMKAALENFDSLSAENKVVILGDMFELGEEAEKEHLEVLKKAAEIAGQKIFIGKEFFKQRDVTEAAFFQTTEEAIDELRNNPLKSCTILIKGSRSMRLEQLLEIL